MSSRQHYDSAAQLLDTVIPFRFLSAAAKKNLVKTLKEYNFHKGDIIYNKGDSDDSIFLIRKGSVETIDYKASGTTRINLITAGHYFGERSAIFNQKRIYTVRALSEVHCYSISGKNFRKLIHYSKSFSKAMSTILRDKQGIFSAFERFKAEVLQGITKGHIEIQELIPYYRDMEPAMHKLLTSNSEIDTAALDYVIKRLPENVTENFIYLLIDELYDHIPEPWKLFSPVPAVARRRRCWRMMNGQTMMLYRPGITDLLDLITCLCVFVVESEKIRKRLSEHRLLISIKNHLVREEEKGNTDKKSDNQFLKNLPFSQKELAGLKIIWPENTTKYLYNAAIHSGEFILLIKKQTETYNTRRAEMWLSQIGDSIKDLTGYKVNELPGNVKIHVISSNTHSVLNCLNPEIISRIDEIIKWGEKTKHPALKQKWFNRYDLLYALAKDFIKETGDDSLKLKHSDGVIVLERTASTGIQVQLFSLKKLKNKKVDPGLPPVPLQSNAIIINIDYAFGEQAEEIMRNLLLQFGKNLASINIIGKAGALVGKRGDILLPDVFIEQSEDLFQPFANRALLTTNRLQKRLDNTKIFKGPMLTVDGTLFQNSLMLSFYKNIWDCVGLEMEGIYYLRQIIEGSQHGLIPNNLFTSFYYYVSDLPGDANSQLTNVMELSEGIPPLYAVTREILTDIFLIESGEYIDEKSFNN